MDAGEDRFSTTSGYEQVRGVVRIEQHPRFDAQTKENDIALLQVLAFENEFLLNLIERRCS